uniref:ribonuclease E/G-like protein, chloroplastic n=1 Tax=Erigeron canadensis TaxID=72917 RepID=UPI001CB97F55|nr:ribonuclease E/G-like protein, chloroplastic [Erigeron canadensis]XP_043631875.1 ribonuclease E/G-like protein, chloroplastic [Erigeron canadensis]
MFSFATNNPKLFNVKAKIHGRESSMQALCDVSWGFRPEYSFLQQLGEKSSRKVLLIRPRIRSFSRSPGKSLARARGEGKILEANGSDLLVSKQLIWNYDFENKFDSEEINAPFSESYYPVEEPWIHGSSPPFQSVRPEDASSGLTKTDKISVDLKVNSLTLSTGDEENTTSVLDKRSLEPHVSECEYPVEEPWLCQSSLGNIESSENERPQHQHPEIAELLTFGDVILNSIGNNTDNEDTTETPKELSLDNESRVDVQESVKKVILINSSLCTMQRIAVMEDDKLVEILLEPVKDNVQADSVYLGTVTKFVPHMGGAFVNIGCARPSLMDTNHNWEPFIFPPFRRHRIKQRKKQTKIVDNSEDHDVIENSVKAMLDYHHEHEIDDEFKDEFNGKRLIHQSLEGAHEAQHQTMTDLSVDAKSSRDAEGSKGPQTDEDKWALVQKGTKIIVQVVKEGLGNKSPTLTAYPKLRSRFWVLMTRLNSIHISKKIYGLERTRLRVIAKTLQPPGFGLTVRTVAAGRTLEELQKDLDGLLSTWKDITEKAKSAAVAADEGVEGAMPVMLHGAMGQTHSVVQDLFNDKVKRMVVDSPATYHEVTNYLQEIAPDLCDRVELYSKKNPLFDEYNIEGELNNMLSKRVPLSNGGYLVLEQTEALVSVDVNGGQCMLGHGTSQDKAILDVNLAAAKQIAREIRLRDIGGIIVVDFIDMHDDSNKRLVYEEVKKAVSRDRSMVKVSELSRHGLMEITRKRVRPSVTFMISEPCSCCHATGRVEALETSYSKIEHEICRLLASMDRADPGRPKSWPKFILRVDRYMCSYLTSGKRTRLAILSSSLKVWILLKVARGLTRGAFEIKPLTKDMEHGNDDDDDEEDQVAMPLLQPTAAMNTSKRKITIFPIKKWKSRGK